MKGKFILISGSAGQSCPADKLDAASQFVRSFTGDVLRRGGGVVVLASDEESVKGEPNASLIFDWLALREVERYANSTTDTHRTYSRIIMSDKALESKIDDANLKMLRILQQRKAVEVYQIRREVFTGGEYRRVMVEKSDAMLAIGGGKGTYAAGTGMIELGKPVLPLDLKLGSTADDGDGAVALHRELATEPERFFPYTYQDVVNRVGLFSLDRGINDVGTAARVSAEMLAGELEVLQLPEQSSTTKGRLTAAWHFVKALPFVASALKIIEWVKGLVPFML